MDKADLKNIEKYGKDRYDSYKFNENSEILKVIITPSFYPNPLNSGLFIYKRQIILDTATKNVSKFFEGVGIKSTLDGPSGLGAPVAMPVSTLLAILRFSIQVAGNLTKSYRESIVRKAKPSIQLELSLCVKNSNGQLSQYAKQFVICVAELIKISDNILPFVNLDYPCSVYDLSTGESISFYMKNGSDLSVLKQLRKIDKSIIVD